MHSEFVGTQSLLPFIEHMGPFKPAQNQTMDAIRTNIPMIVFAQASDERDYLRNVLSQMNSTVLCFEKEAICFDNLASINPKLILVRTDSRAIAWRFIFALRALGKDCRLVLMSNVLKADIFNRYGLDIRLHLMPCNYEPKILPDSIGRFMNKSKQSHNENGHGLLVGENPTLKAINTILSSLVNTSDHVLIEGEVGTGKEMLAGMIARSAGGDALFVKVNCEALISERTGGNPGLTNGLYSQILQFIQSVDAKNKTITVLLDKVNRLNKKAQSEILLFWEKGLTLFDNCGNECFPNVRLISTSEVGLDRMVQRDHFRKELFYRLNVIPIHIPPLRERKEDIPSLMDYFVVEACAKLKRSFLLPTANLFEQFGAYHWPGNVEELKNLMAGLAASGDETQILRKIGIQKFKQDPYQYLRYTIDKDDVPNNLEIQNCFAVMGNTSLKSISDKFVYRTEKNLVRKALESTHWNRKKAAALLSISYKSMLNKMKMYEIV
jgi:DNA-binding NtrC family response regulator